MTLRHQGKLVYESDVKISSYRKAVECVVVALSHNVKGGNLELTKTSRVGHRVVHGGERFQTPVVIDNDVKAAIQDLARLAPLHNPPALAVIEAAMEAVPQATHVAVFDTAFHATLPPKSFLYPVPYDWYENWSIRRFGFHGISHEWCVLRASELLKRDLRTLRIISCHLGNGCSATATDGGRAVATTMGYTPLDGLMMGTRSGAVDPGLLLFLQDSHRLDAKSLGHALNFQSGLLGISGLSSDFRTVESAAGRGKERAALAIEMFVDRIRSSIAALAATTSGTDVIVFTGGIGENSASLRRKVCEGLEFMGVHLDTNRNQENEPETDVAAQESPVRLLIIAAREELMLAQKVDRALMRKRRVDKCR